MMRNISFIGVEHVKSIYLIELYTAVYRIWNMMGITVKGIVLAYTIIETSVFVSIPPYTVYRVMRTIF